MDVLLPVLLVLAFACNVVALWMILRQDVRKLDLGLALVMAACDLVLVTYKLCELVYVAASGDLRLKDDVVVGQWHGLLTTFMLHLSAMSVGYMAALRFWIIVMRRRANAQKWWTAFWTPQLLMLVWLIVIACQGNFKSLQNRTLFFPDVDADSWVVKVCRAHLVISHLWAALAVNVSYPWIARIYDGDLRLLHTGEVLHKQARAVYFKIIGLVLFYDVVILPVLVAMIVEAFTGKLKSVTLEAFAILTFIGMTLVNPIVLLTLHHETQCEFRDVLKQLKGRFDF